jgi:prolipoprotein diacylglyceryltransferase
MTIHLIFELFSYFIGFQYYQYLRRSDNSGLDDDSRIWIIIGGILGAAFGSKMLACFEHPYLFELSKDNFLYLLSSKTIVGGLMGGIIGVESAKKFLKVSRSTGDLFCFPIILGMIIGRIGCFFAGAQDGTWGNATSMFTGIDGGDGIIRHPAPLYEIVFLCFAWIVLFNLKKKLNFQNGSIFKIFMISYLSWRFLIEFIKPVYVIDPFGISAIQIACLLGLIYYHKAILSPRNLLIK